MTYLRTGARVSIDPDCPEPHYSEEGYLIIAIATDSMLVAGGRLSVAVLRIYRNGAYIDTMTRLGDCVQPYSARSNT